ncbi:hypothetical protein [Catellatospora sp. NPDC049609]|uniref:hypothetical protein n=1 Tax=Catellatospora sp. NPDC049609 TaxID=3155505 RepID=UPI00342D000C
MRGPDSLGRGWWRRNVWGLLAVVPAFVAMGYASIYNDLDRWERGEPKPVAAAADGWVDFGGVRLRLVEIAPATDLKRFNREPFTVPQGIVAWRAVFEIQASGPEVPFCSVELEDAAGNVYDDRPDELSRADADRATCAPDDSPVPAASGRHQAAAYFVTAAGAEPVAVRVTFGSVDLARYARLSR